MMKIKPGVDCSHVQPELLLGIMVAASVYASLNADCVITSLRDGKHGPGTLHQREGMCRAADLRINHLAHELLANLMVDLKTALGAQYDCVLETDHIHLEYDPK